MTFTKRFLNYKVLTVVFLFLSLIGSVYLVQLVQENRGQAKPKMSKEEEQAHKEAEKRKAERAAEEASKPTSAYDAKRAAEEAAKAAEQAAKQAQENAALKAKYGNDINKCYAEKSKKTCDDAFAKPDYTEIPADSKAACTANGGAWCGGCGGFCISNTSSVGCNTAGLEKCNAPVIYGGNYIAMPSGGCKGTYYMPCTCGNTKLCFDHGLTKEQGATDDQCGGPEGLCKVYDNNKNNETTGGIYFCANLESDPAKGGSSCDARNGVKLTSVPSCFCGTIQVDTVGGGYKSYTSKCGCKEGGNTTEEETPTTPPQITATNTPTLKPTITNTPTVTPTIASQSCGYTPCSTSQPCSSGLVCITANNGNNYCSQPDFVSACIASPGYNSCCTIPTNTPTNTPTPTNTLTPTPTPTGVWLSPTPTPTRVAVTSGPSPTRIILPNSGVEFPIQILTIAGVITTLVGFLILL